MKIFINTLNRANTISTPALLDAGNIPYNIIFHNEQSLQEYLAAGRIRKETAIVANQPVGMVNIRNWVLENFVAEGEWFLILDDNITEFQAVPLPESQAEQLPVKMSPEYYSKIFTTTINAAEFIDICEETIAEAERRGAKLAGFASNTNFYFRAKKWREVGYVIGKTQLIKKTKLRYDKNVFATDDYLWTAQNLEAFGKVLINNYAVAIKKHYAKGGIGPYEERLSWKLKDVDYLMARFPELFRYKIKKGCHPKAEIQVRFTNLDQVFVWRTRLAHEKENKEKLEVVERH